MTRRSAYAALILLAGTTTSAAFAQANSNPSTPGTNSAGTAQSSGGASNRAAGVTTGSAGLGSGRAGLEPSTSADAAVKAENELLNRKLKSICRGC
jgi:hypothetical protein